MANLFWFKGPLPRYGFGKTVGAIALTLYAETKWWSERSHKKQCMREETSGMAWLITDMWQLKRVRRNTDKERCFYVQVKRMINTCYWIVWKL